MRAIQRFLAGDRRAFDVICTKYGPRLFAQACRFFKNEHDAANAVQDTFCKLISSLSKYDPDQRFENWLSTILRNRCRDLLRGKNRRRAGQLFDDMNVDAAAAGSLSADADAADPSKLAEKAEELAELKKAIEQLPSDERELIRRRYLDGQTGKQIADDLGLCESTVSDKLTKARCILVQILDRERGDVK